MFKKIIEWYNERKRIHNYEKFCIVLISRYYNTYRNVRHISRELIDQLYTVEKNVHIKEILKSTKEKMENIDSNT